MSERYALFVHSSMNVNNIIVLFVGCDLGFTHPFLLLEQVLVLIFVYNILATYVEVKGHLTNVDMIAG